MYLLHGYRACRSRISYWWIYQLHVPMYTLKIYMVHMYSMLMYMYGLRQKPWCIFNVYLFALINDTGRDEHAFRQFSKLWMVCKKLLTCNCSIVTYVCGNTHTCMSVHGMAPCEENSWEFVKWKKRLYLPWCIRHREACNDETTHDMPSGIYMYM